MTDPLLIEYNNRYDRVLKPVATQLENLLLSHLSGSLRVDRVTARAKAPERFMEKALRQDGDGALKYTVPLTQIQDQLGARIVVFYNSDVDTVSDTVLRYFTAIEQKAIVPDSEWAFGYFGKHFILALPPDAIPKEIDVGDVPRFFELQIKTLFQHAWSEANHDLGYKPLEQLTNDQKRRLAYTAAQAWGADRIFHELFEDLQPAETQAVAS